MEMMTLYMRELPDGRSIIVYPITFGRARVAIGKDLFIDDLW